MNEVTEWSDVDVTSRVQMLDEILETAYRAAEVFVENGTETLLAECGLDQKVAEETLELARAKHAFRGAALTLLAAKACHPAQDVRAHKSEHPNGFAARTFDSRSTIPFLIEHSLPRSVESHWLTQTLSFAGPLETGSILKTQPKKVGPLFVNVINYANDDETGDIARKMLLLIFVALIEIRNRERVVLTRPKSLPIVTVDSLLRRHMSVKYKTGAPRLPQIAIYAIYCCLISKIDRFSAQELEPLARMKSADRKAGTVGDIVVVENGKPVEAVEIKFDKSISLIDVLEAIDKVRAESVSRYYLLSTVGIDDEQAATIVEKSEEFEKQNGCEIIVNGVFETVRYYLRLLPDTTEFLNFYADIVEQDEDVGYEHRIAWNECCAQI
ncbi:restriction endonuclease, SacI family [Tropicimonas sp. TH_r6]|uniref:restriction endonuclease, SacI family n=1 Tax=Tropicimonas sp. TH_r6 TaxID=3082085 RepID=UPI002953AEEA|nr:restriction endonuclease, SacI family [Tropicimonas sp. TH_r6]MDV7145999.1 restriction endonuclease, SacI family [Tropicimonas sp. TH_r6]